MALMIEFFLTGKTQSYLIWPFFFACRRRNDRPEGPTRPGMVIQKNSANACARFSGLVFSFCGAQLYVD